MKFFNQDGTFTQIGRVFLLILLAVMAGGAIWATVGSIG